MPPRTEGKPVTIETLRYKIGEAAYFLDTMRYRHSRIVETIRQSPEVVPLSEDLAVFKYALSAFLCATAMTLEGYMRGALRREHYPWLEGKTGNTLFRAFRYARNFEQHQETVKISRTNVTGMFGPKDPHIALAFHLLDIPLGEVRLHYSTDPVVGLSSEYLGEWTKIIEEAHASGYLRMPSVDAPGS